MLLLQTPFPLLRRSTFPFALLVKPVELVSRVVDPSLDELREERGQRRSVWIEEGSHADFVLQLHLLVLKRVELIAVLQVSVLRLGSLLDVDLPLVEDLDASTDIL